MKKKRRNHDSTRQKNRKKIVGNKNVKACTTTVVCGLESWESWELVRAELSAGSSRGNRRLAWGARVLNNIQYPGY